MNEHDGLKLMSEPELPPSDDPKKMGFLDTLKSVLWAMLGVRGKNKAQKDFTQGKASHFIIIGILFALVFILVLSFVVRSVIPA